jgi:N utilization substance protein B
MKSRHRAREVALQVLYRYDVAKPAGPEPVLARSLSPEFVRELGAHFDHFDVPRELREFAAQLVTGTLGELSELDSVLETQAANWKVARMPSVDRSLLRMAVYELKHFPETDATVVIDEAIELAKQFGTAETPAFVNGVLDALRGRVRG